MTPEPDNLDPLHDLLARADATSACGAVSASAIASAALARVHRRRQWRRGVAVGALTVSCALMVSLLIPLIGAKYAARSPRPGGSIAGTPPATRPDVDQLRAEIASLRARADQLERDLRAMRERQAASPARIEEACALVRAAVDEQRDRAAYAIVRGTDRCRDAGAEASLVATGYRRAADAFPDTRWGAAARSRLDHPQ